MSKWFKENLLPETAAGAILSGAAFIALAIWAALQSWDGPLVALFIVGLMGGLLFLWNQASQAYRRFFGEGTINRRPNQVIRDWLDSFGMAVTTANAEKTRSGAS
jgi:hypothetical protein